MYSVVYGDPILLPCFLGSKGGGGRGRAGATRAVFNFLKPSSYLSPHGRSRGGGRKPGQSGINDDAIQSRKKKSSMGGAKESGTWLFEKLYTLNYRTANKFSLFSVFSLWHSGRRGGTPTKLWLLSPLRRSQFFASALCAKTIRLLLFPPHPPPFPPSPRLLKTSWEERRKS